MPLTYAGFVQEVREYMRDFPALNRLLYGEETNSRLIEYCVRLAVDEYNTTPPLISTVGIDNFPSRSILLDLTIIRVLSSVGLLHSRNRLVYNEGGFSGQSETQDTFYQQWIQFFRAQVYPRLQALKVALNIQGAWGYGVPSEYAWIDSWYGVS